MLSGLQTDHTNVMKEIEEELHRIHLQVRQQRGHEEMPMEVSPAVSPSNQAQPFARIDRVDATSPAAVGVCTIDHYIDIACCTGVKLLLDSSSQTYILFHVELLIFF